MFWKFPRFVTAVVTAVGGHPVKQDALEASAAANSPLHLGPPRKTPLSTLPTPHGCLFGLSSFPPAHREMIIAAEGFELRSRSSNAHYWEQGEYPPWTALGCYQHFPDGAPGTGVEPHYHGPHAPALPSPRCRFTSRCGGRLRRAVAIHLRHRRGVGRRPAARHHPEHPGLHAHGLGAPLPDVQPLRERASSGPRRQSGSDHGFPRRTRSSRGWSGSAARPTSPSPTTVRQSQPSQASSCLASTTTGRSPIPARAAP